MARIIYDLFEARITAEGIRVVQEHTLDKSIISVNGVAITSDYDDLLYHRGRHSVVINKMEIFPEKYECKMNMSGINTDVNRRYKIINPVPAGNGLVKLIYKDTNHNRTPFIPYVVTLYLECTAND